MKCQVLAAAVTNQAVARTPRGLLSSCGCRSWRGEAVDEPRTCQQCQCLLTLAKEEAGKRAPQCTVCRHPLTFKTI